MSSQVEANESMAHVPTLSLPSEGESLTSLSRGELELAEDVLDIFGAIFCIAQWLGKKQLRLRRQHLQLHHLVRGPLSHVAIHAC